ncbi:MAG: chromosomal replication initiator protein DnaA [Alphaproteobacteria bacterium]|nr:chromosomal replication initiator protein DnaA [Alphaproteobacteria bacterium]MBU1562360.1 chromosomal replication initiator protein DnaA [Alphaproteobacteria bacterium]MBU2302668.1 chromosomal replication initiator protein DnaA [Alphaproteobacteria bacterium]MBU2369237.1 chromosomal replication initiator protein DnaA [Alphaproteobacteria bacterium]
MSTSDTPDGQRELWNRVRARLKAGVGEDVFASWFARLELEEMVDDVVHLSAPTRFLCSWVQSNYAERILEAFRLDNEEVSRIQVTLRVNGQARPRLAPAAEPATNHETAAPAIAATPMPTSHPRLVRDNSAAKGDALAGSAIDARMTFDTFVPGSANEMALGVAKQIAAAAANNTVTFNPVYIHSTVGLGKSHLLNAIAHAVQSADATKNIVYLTADHFMYHFITAVQRQSALGFKEWLRRVDLLLIDDMQFLQGKSATEFGHTLGTLLTGAKQVVVAGDAPPRDLEMLDERVRSRLSGGLVVPISGFDLELRRSIVQRRADQATARYGMHFPAPVLDYIARAVISHGRDLDGAVNRLVAANQLTGELITVPLAEKTLGDLIRSREARRVRIEDILKIVSRHYKVPRNELLSARRSRDVVRPRQIAMFLAKALTSRSLPEIGRRFGGRDHTTVLHSVRKVEQMIKDDIELAQEIELLKRMLEE